jgi:hypothetical protein
METIKIFLASSSELKEDRVQFELFINKINKEWVKQGVFFELVVWEDFIDAMSATRLQDEYNKAIPGCDIFVMLFQNKVGKYTEEEFNTAFKQFNETKKPFVYTYFKDTGDEKIREENLHLFREKLKALGHFETVYKNAEGLLLHFNGQLIKLHQAEFKKMLAPERAGSIQVAEKIYNISHIDNANFD